MANLWDFIFIFILFLKWNKNGHANARESCHQEDHKFIRLDTWYDNINYYYNLQG